MLIFTINIVCYVHNIVIYIVIYVLVFNDAVVSSNVVE